jgi:hypothetical protein
MSSVSFSFHVNNTILDKAAYTTDAAAFDKAGRPYDCTDNEVVRIHVNSITVRFFCGWFQLNN